MMKFLFERWYETTEEAGISATLIVKHLMDNDEVFI